MSTTPAQAQANVSQSKRVPSFKSSWQHLILERSELPTDTRCVLWALSIGFMDERGEHCFPTIEHLMQATGMSNKTIIKNLGIAESQGWIHRRRYGRTRGYRRWNYVAMIPEKYQVGAATAREMVNAVDHQPATDAVPDNELVNAVHQQSATDAVPDRELVNAVHHKPCNRDLYKPGERGAENSQAAGAASLSSIKKPIKTALSEDWTLPPEFISFAMEARPELGVDYITGMGAAFKAYHRGEGSKKADWFEVWRRWVYKEDPSKSGKRLSCRAGKPAHSGLTEQRQQENEARMEAANAHSLRRWHKDVTKLGIDTNTGLKPTSVPAPPVATRMTGIRSEPRPEPDAQDKLRSERRAMWAEQYRRDHGRPLPASCVV